MEYQKITLRQLWGLVYPYTRVNLAIVSYNADIEDYLTTYGETTSHVTNISGEFPEDWQQYADWCVYLVQSFKQGKMYVYIRKEEEK